MTSSRGKHRVDADDAVDAPVAEGQQLGFILNPVRDGKDGRILSLRGIGFEYPAEDFQEL